MKASTVFFFGIGAFGLYKWFEKTVTELTVDVAVQDLSSVNPLRITISNPNIQPLYISGAEIYISATLQGAQEYLARVRTGEVYLPGYDSAVIVPEVVTTPSVMVALKQLLLQSDVLIYVDGWIELGP